MGKYISSAAKKTPLIDQIVNVLRRGPCSAMQISKRLGTSSSNVSAVCYRNLDIFEKLEEKQIGDKRPVYFWKLRNPE